LKRCSDCWQARVCGCSIQVRVIPSFSQHLREADARGNLAFDAQIAAVCVEHRVTALLTADRDFARFAKLKRLSLSDAPT